jgi:hypothetical protein
LKKQNEDLITYTTYGDESPKHRAKEEHSPHYEKNEFFDIKEQPPKNFDRIQRLEDLIMVWKHLEEYQTNEEEVILEGRFIYDQKQEEDEGIHSLPYLTTNQECFQLLDGEYIIANLENYDLETLPKNKKRVLCKGTLSVQEVPLRDLCENEEAIDFLPYDQSKVVFIIDVKDIKRSKSKHKKQKKK